MKSPAEILSKHQGLINYTILNYFDRFLTFAIPLAVLYLFQNKLIYNDLEYIYSVAAIAAIIIELGVRNYFLYAYRESSNREQLVHHVKSLFLFQFLVYSVLSLIILATVGFVTANLTFIYFYIIVRTLSTYLISFFTIYYRLVDKPSRVFMISLSLNISTILLLLAAKYYFHEINLMYLFVMQFVLCLAAVLYFLTTKAHIAIGDFLNHAKPALKYSWPIILNLFLFMGINNFGKLYARNFLGTEDMFQISFIQRLALFIQLAHLSASSYYSKSIFISPVNKVDRKVLTLYSGMIFSSVAAVFIILTALHAIKPEMAVNIGWITIFIIGYTMVWCYTAYFELYVNRLNMNKYILLFSGISVLSFWGSWN